MFRRKKQKQDANVSPLVGLASTDADKQDVKAFLRDLTGFDVARRLAGKDKTPVLIEPAEGDDWMPTGEYIDMEPQIEGAIYLVLRPTTPQRQALEQFILLTQCAWEYPDVMQVVPSPRAVARMMEADSRFPTQRAA